MALNSDRFLRGRHLLGQPVEEYLAVFRHGARADGKDMAYQVGYDPATELRRHGSLVTSRLLASAPAKGLPIATFVPEL